MNPRNAASSGEKLVLLAILAHPDDESFGMGGTLAKYAAEGIETHVCIATDGAAGSTDEKFLEGYESLAQRRAQELQNAVQVLGATLHLLGYGDSGMEGSPDNQNPDSLVQAPLDEVACRIVRLMREVRPQVVVTHDPTGGYFHPDHIKVCEAVNLAWERVNDPAAYPELGLPPWQPTRLFWPVFSRRWLRWFIRFLRLIRQDPTHFGRNKDIDMTRLGVPDEEIHTHIDVRPYLEVKGEAGRQHASQQGPPTRMPGFLQRRLFGTESYTQAQPASPRATRDLFEGLH